MKKKNVNPVIIIISLVIIIIFFGNMGLLSFLDYSPEYDVNYDSFTTNDLVEVSTGTAISTCGADCKTGSSCYGGSYCTYLGSYTYLNGSKWYSITNTRYCYNGAALGTDQPIVSVSGGSMTLTPQYKTTTPLRARMNFFNKDFIVSLRTSGQGGGTSINGLITSSVIYEIIWNPENINQYAVFANGLLVKNGTITNSQYYLEFWPVIIDCDKTQGTIIIDYIRYRSTQPGTTSTSTGGIRTRTFSMPDYTITPGSKKYYELIIDVERIKSGTTSKFVFDMTSTSSAGTLTKVYEFTVKKQ